MNPPPTESGDAPSDRPASVGRRGLLAAGVAGFAALVSACANATHRSVTGRSASLSPAATPSPHRSESTPPRQPARLGAGPAKQINQGPRTSHQVALTFHTAGDPAVVDEILRAAHHTGAKLTMLVVGTWLAQYPSYARQILAAGHDLGNHTWSHPVLTEDDASQTRQEIVRCRDLLQRLTGNAGAWFRPSGTPSATPLMLREAGRAGYPTVLAYDVDPLDYTNPGASTVTQRVIDAVHPGAIVSLHTLYAGTAQALPDIVDGLRHKGLQPVTASRLLARKI
jgi:peptidoglycan/xylan/chitin deacetylase (PgdA/CDA1 family)